MSKPEKPSGAKILTGIVIGAIMMGGGMYLSVNHIPNMEALEKMGIPLDPGKTVAVMGVFFILFPVIHSFFLAPLGEAIYNRSSELESTFGEAESLRNEMATMKKEYEARIAASEAAAREQIQQQISEAQKLRAELMTEASQKADELVRQAREDIDSERERVVAQLRVSMVNLTMQATEKVLGENIDNERNQRLVKEFIDKVEVPA